MRPNRNLSNWRILLIVIGVSCWECQAGSITPFLGTSRSSPSLNPEPSGGSAMVTQNSFTFGALFSTPIEGSYYFDSGIQRLNRQYRLGAAPSGTLETSRGWLIPLSFRFMRVEYFGFGFGPYVAFLEERAQKKSYDVGLRASLRVAYPISSGWSVVGEGNFLIGVTDQNESNVAEDKSKDLLFWIGMEIPLTQPHQEP